MPRLNIVVEGRSEESFVKKILAPYLGAMNIFCSARCVATSRNKEKFFRGGLLEYSHLKNDLGLWFKEDNNPDAFFSTMIDLYKLPPEFPDSEKACKLSDPFDRVACLEKAFSLDMNHPRFLPYIQLHEFEALLLCDPTQLSRLYPYRTRDIASLANSCSAYPSPDLIDDGEHTAPSKRIIAKVPEYENEKAFAGPLIAEYIGLNNLKKCVHFSAWLQNLEQLTGKLDKMGS